MTRILFNPHQKLSQHNSYHQNKILRKKSGGDVFTELVLTIFFYFVTAYFIPERFEGLQWCIENASRILAHLQITLISKLV